MLLRLQLLKINILNSLAVLPSDPTQHSFPALLSPILSLPSRSDNPIPSSAILSSAILSYPILSYPILSYPILSYPILSYPILSYPILSNTWMLILGKSNIRTDLTEESVSSPIQCF